MDKRHNEPSFYLVILHGRLSILPNCVFKGMESKPWKNHQSETDDFEKC
jgi:hypothetical protein